MIQISPFVVRRGPIHITAHYFKEFRLPVHILDLIFQITRLRIWMEPEVVSNLGGQITELRAIHLSGLSPIAHFPAAPAHPLFNTIAPEVPPLAAFDTATFFRTPSRR
jgi:hypothetical protein